MKKLFATIALVVSALALQFHGPLSASAALYGFVVGNVTTSSANLSGTISGPNPDVEVVWGMDYKLDYEHSFVPTLNSKGGFSENLTNLVPNTKYKVRLVRASDREQYVSDEHTFTTLSVVAMPSVESLGSDTVTLRATASDGAGEITVYYGFAVDALSNQAVMTKNSDGTYSVKLTGLTPQKDYLYKLYGKNNYDSPVAYTPDAYGFTTQAADTAGDTVASIKQITDTTVGPIGIGAGTGGGSTGKAEGLVTCGNDGQPKCTFNDVVALVNRLLTFIMFYIVPAIGTMLIVYAGFIFLTAGGSEEKVSKAKGILQNAVVGMVLVMSSWIIVKSILVALGYDTNIFPSL